MLIYEQISQQKGSWLFLRRITTQVCKMSSVNPKVVMKMYGVASPNLQDAVLISIPRYPLLESAALTTYFRPRGPLPFKMYFRERVFSQPLLPLLLSLSNQGEQICTKIGG